MPRKTATRRGVLTLTGGVLVGLAGCSDTGGQESTETETGTPAGTPMDGTETGTGAETDTGTETGTDEESPTEEETGTETDGDAMLRVAHLAPDAPDVDVAVDDSTVLSNASFETVSDYLTVSPGDHQVTVTPTGGSSSVFDETVTLVSGPQTAAAVGEVAGGDQAFTVSLFTDDTSAPATGNTKLRAVHAVPDAPAVDVTADDRVVSDNVAFGEGGQYNTVPSYVRSVAVRPESSADNEDRVGTFRVDTPSGGVETVFLTGYLEPTEQQPELRAVVTTDPTDTEAETGTAAGTETATATGTGTENGTGTETGTGTGTETETVTDGL